MKRRSTKPRRRNPDGAQALVPSLATVTRFDGGIDGQAVKLEFVFQPKDAQRLADFLLNAVLDGRNRRK